MLTEKQYLLYLTLKYNGDWNNIYQAIMRHETKNDEEVLALCDTCKDNYITILDKQLYPKTLRENTQQPPFVLFYKGDINLLNSPNKRISVVGSANYTNDNLKSLEMLLKSENKAIYVLSESKAQLITDLVKATGNKTIAVLAYPVSQAKGNYDLVLSEHPTPVEIDYPTRYRIMVGISNKVLISNCSRQSGLNVLVSYALQSGLDVLAIPHSITEDNNINNLLIYQGAIPVIDGRDLGDD